MPARLQDHATPSSLPPWMQHGGDLAAARAAFPDAPEPWIDLSTGISPFAYAVGGLPPGAWERLPDPTTLAMLEDTARACYRAPSATGIVAAPGTQALISMLPRAWPARRVAVLGFGYAEHPATWRGSGADVTIAPDLQALAEADVGIVVNPNNPDGRTVPAPDLARLAAYMAQHGRTLIVDEAFADVRPPSDSLVPLLPESGALILRSFGKFFGLAGMRLGFALGDQRLCAALRLGLGPWPVSGPTIAVGTRALADVDWQEETRSRLAASAGRLRSLLEGAGLEVMGGTSLFVLARHADAPRLFDGLARAGILVRPFSAHPSWLRFGLPRDETAWERLTCALRPGTC